MKPTEIVSDYSVMEEDNLRHNYKAAAPQEGANNQQNIEIRIVANQRPTEPAPTDS